MLSFPFPEGGALTTDMSFLHLGLRNKIILAQGIHHLHYSISETRWFLETNPRRHRACRLAHLGAAGEVLGAITTPESYPPHQISLG